MITYCIEDKILFPCDIFSTHVANYEYFNDMAKGDINDDYSGYYKLIMHPHRRYVQIMIDKIRDLDIKMIAPSHGYILRDNVQSFIDIYDNMSKNTETNKKTLILYSTMTGRTKKIAAAFGSYGWSGEAIEVVQGYLKQSNIKALSTSDVIKSTGMIDIEFPLRIRFSPNGDNLKSIEIAVNYTADLLLGTV